MALRYPAPRLEEFSQRSRSAQHDLGRDLLRALRAAADGDTFLRGGHPKAETLLLLAIKMHDYERSRPALYRGRLVLEGRSVDTVAVYQSLILMRDDEAALEQARGIVDLSTAWRPLPDLTILVIDDVDTALQRAQRRDNRVYTDEERRLHHRAATLFHRLASDDPQRLAVLDRRVITATNQAVIRMQRFIHHHQATTPCVTVPWSVGEEARPCQGACRLAPSAGTQACRPA